MSCYDQMSIDMIYQCYIKSLKRQAETNDGIGGWYGMWGKDLQRMKDAILKKSIDEEKELKEMGLLDARYGCSSRGAYVGYG